MGRQGGGWRPWHFWFIFWGGMESLVFWMGEMDQWVCDEQIDITQGQEKEICV